MLSRRRPDDGSSLVLMPAAALVFVVLGAFCVDLAAVHLGQRELVTAAQGAANDAAASGFDEGAFYDGGSVTLDPLRVRRAVVASLAANLPEARVVGFRLDAAGSTVVVELVLDVPTVFARALPGGPETVQVSARASADLREG